MAEKERVRQKQKSTEKSKVSEESTQVQHETIVEDSKVEDEESEVVTVKEITASSVEERKQQSDVMVKEPEFLPSWGDVKQTEWMYHIPIREEDLEMWSSEWADFVLEWCETFTVHILTFSMFVSEIPFKEIQNKADAYRIIGDKLVEINCVSPGGIPRINALDKVKLETKVIDFIEGKVREMKRKNRVKRRS